MNAFLKLSASAIALLTALFLFTAQSAKAAVTYYSQCSCDPAATTNWNSVRGGGGSTPAGFIAGDVFVIQNGHNMTTTAAWAISGSGSKLQIENGGTLTANQAITLATATTLQIDAGGTYVHNNTSGFASTIFHAGTKSLDPASTVILNNSSTTGPSNVTFGNLTINFTTDPGNVNCGGSLTTINGNLTIINTQASEFRFSANSAYVLNLAGDMIIQGGTLNLTNGSSVGPFTLNIGGNFNQSGGTFTSSNTAAPATVVFTNGAATATFTQSGGTLTGTNINWQIASGKTLVLQNNLSVAGSRSLTIGSGGALNAGTNAIMGAGNLILNSGASLYLGSPDGIDSGTALGNIRVSGTRTFDPASNYDFDGASPQVTGNGFHSTINNLSVDDPNGLTLTNDVAVNGTLALSSGDLNTGSHVLTLGPNATTSGSGDVIGNVHRSGLIASTTYSFGNPNVAITFDSTSTGIPSDITLNLTKSVPGDFTQAVARTYILTPTAAGTFSATLRLPYQDADLNGNTETALQLWRFAGTNWNLQMRTNADTTNNWVEKSGVTEFSRWAISTNGSPTIVTLTDFTARLNKPGPLALTLACIGLALLGLLSYISIPKKRN